MEPERGVLGTRLLSHFFFNTFLRLHPRVKMSMTSPTNEPFYNVSTATASNIAIQLHSEWLELLTKLATTSPSASRCLMHFLYVTPTQPCL